MLVRCIDEEDLGFKAAKVFVEQFHLAIKKHGQFNVLLSGGKTPLSAYKNLCTPYFSNQIFWEKVNIFWGDERCVGPYDKRSNYLMAFQNFLSFVPISRSQIYPIDNYSDPKSSATEYEKLLKTFFQSSGGGFDLAFLGLGVDGHTASLFPGDETINEKEHWVKVVKRKSESFFRITLTLPIINRSHMIVFLVTGYEKSQILKKVLHPTNARTFLPAQKIHAMGELLWLVDDSALA